ncbi:Phage portal protein, SPP1 Gp6-like [Streptomonospora litoralis]|uniref:Phage portal protein, SPP1 Gp6-like n=1 Tax=Streptomonospora litoralis TaxID=2498135 RepID=A0A4P6PZ69_9ACTN|nr:Phage portal protein, SPP1 Gp6-like [Streptomonospora litoralis]
MTVELESRPESTILDQTPESPGWWLIRLGRRLQADREQMDKLDGYDRGDHPLPTGHRRAAESYRRFQEQARSNFTGLVVEAVLERLRVLGFRQGADGQGADSEAARIWQANSLDADSGLLHRAALVMRRSYAIVGRDPQKPETPLITIEDPREVIHARDPLRRRRVRAALKWWCDEFDGYDRAVVYLPTGVHYFRATSKDASNRWSANRWGIDESEGQDGYAAAPIDGLVPVVPFINRPHLDGYGVGEFEDVCDIQDRINNTTLHRMIVAAMQAFRQRVLTGPELEREDLPFDPGADLLWVLDSPEFKIEELGQADLGPLLKAAEADVRDLAAITRTPPHYLLGEIVNASGDALKAAETGLVSKALERQRQFGESWEQVLDLAFRITGREAAVDSETIWKDPESRSMAELADAALKRKQVGVPWRQNMEDLNYTPAQIERMEADRATEMFQAHMAANPPPPTAGAQNRGGLPPTEEDENAAAAPPAGGQEPGVGGG